MNESYWISRSYGDRIRYELNRRGYSGPDVLSIHRNIGRVIEDHYYFTSPVEGVATDLLLAWSIDPTAIGEAAQVRNAARLADLLCRPRDEILAILTLFRMTAPELDR